MPIPRRKSEEEPDAPTEEDDVFDPAFDGYVRYWRKQFRKYGWTRRQTEAVIAARADLYKVRDVLEAGCPADTAFLIFS